MGDRTWTNLQFTVPDPVPEGLEDSVADDMNMITSGGEIVGQTLVLVPGASFDGACEEADYGELECEDMLRDLRIPYRTSWCAGGNYGPGSKSVHYENGEPIDLTVCNTQDGCERAVIDADLIRMILTDETKPDDERIVSAVAHLDQLAPVFPDLPTPKKSDEEAVAWLKSRMEGGDAP